MKAMYSRKVVDKKTTQEEMDMLGLKETRWVGKIKWSLINGS